MMFSEWNWTEISEGISVSLLFILLPVLWRVEKHRKASERRHEEAMAHHKANAEHLKDIKEKL